jgi:uncharacterized membrane protein YphA (DoxX/SURF4 family)
VSKTKAIVLWVLQILLVFPFLAAGIPKLAGNPAWVARFRAYAYPEKFLLLIGAVELLGALALLISRLAPYGATVLIAVMIGATVTHLLHSEARRALVTVALIVFLAVVGYARRPDSVRRRENNAASPG